MEWWYCKTRWNGYGMLPGTCGGKEAGAGNTAFFSGKLAAAGDVIFWPQCNGGLQLL